MIETLRRSYFSLVWIMLLIMIIVCKLNWILEVYSYWIVKCYVRYGAHILNLIAQDEWVIKIWECIKFIKVLEGMKNKFFDCVTQVEIMGNKKGLRQDVPT